jgi:putative mycofactocin binding protein MftB
VSTKAFDLDAAWRLHPQVSIRPERFGALLYHFGTRRLSFLKSPALLTVVSSLSAQPSARAACAEAGIGPADQPAYTAALATLAASQMICGRTAS